jgi:hypothetical protein
MLYSGTERYLIINDMAPKKKGQHSAGVARQYYGQLGRTTGGSRLPENHRPQGYLSQPAPRSQFDLGAAVDQSPIRWPITFQDAPAARGKTRRLIDCFVTPSG